MSFGSAWALQALALLTLLSAGAANSQPAYAQSGCVQVDSVSTAAVLLPNEVMPGSILIVSIFSNTVGPIPESVSDTLGSAFQPLNDVLIVGSTVSQLWYGLSSAGGPDTVTAQLQGTPLGFVIYVHEYTGVDPVSPVAAQVRGSDFGTLITPGPLEVNGAAVLFARANQSQLVASVDPPFVPRENCWDDLTADLQVTASGTYQVFFTGGAPGLWTSDMVALREVSPADPLSLTVGCGCAGGGGGTAGHATVGWILSGVFLARSFGAWRRRGRIPAQ